MGGKQDDGSVSSTVTARVLGQKRVGDLRALKTQISCGDPGVNLPGSEEHQGL